MGCSWRRCWCLALDEEWASIDRKKHNASQKKLYKKHPNIRGILLAALPYTEYPKMSDKSTAKVMFASLCANYEGNKKVREAKATMLVHQYELLKMKDDESIESSSNFCSRSSFFNCLFSFSSSEFLCTNSNSVEAYLKFILFNQVRSSSLGWT